MKRVIRITSFALSLLLLGGCKQNSHPAAKTPAPITELRVAAAADLQFALKELSTQFESAHPQTKLLVTYGSSGNFFAQIQNQAPFDVYFSADIGYPRKLADAGLALDGNVFTYAIGRIVIWVPESSPIDVGKLGIESLFAPNVKKIAIANPQHAPYGKAAVAAMSSLGVYQRVEPSLVYGENISQTAQFIQSGSADIGIIALSLAVAPEMKSRGRYWEIPLDAFPKMEQGGMILKSATQVKAARAFVEFSTGTHGRELLERYGFFLPEN